MSDYRIGQHPILAINPRPTVEFSWKGEPLTGQEGETIAAALFAHGIRIFGHHSKDGSPQGIFCANGQCAQCLVIADGLPVKACMQQVHPGMRLESVEGLPILPPAKAAPTMKPVELARVPALIIGGGPAGLSAALQLARAKVNCLVVDDKHLLGGKLVLQTHRFFGSQADVYAGTRGIDIATKLADEVRRFREIEVWLNSTALAVFSDKKVGILREGNLYTLVKPEILLVACGAREKSLAFPGNTLPGVYGAGAFQTLVNRDLVRPAKRLFIVGGGNVGLIAGYHALQAGIQVVGLVEALPECGGYKVHKDKLARMGVPIYTSHTILSANGKDEVESVTIARVEENFTPVPGTERSFACDTVLIAVGLDPVNEFYLKAKEFGLAAYVAGDAEEIAEASAAIFSGRIRGLEMAHRLGAGKGEVPASWNRTAEILKSKPGKITAEVLPEEEMGITPVIHCSQEIPCNPCATVCPQGLIQVDQSDIRRIPTFLGDCYSCEYCERCVAGCPGLAVTLVNFEYDSDNALVTIPYEFLRGQINPEDCVTGLDTQGDEVGHFRVASVASIPDSDRTMLVRIVTPRDLAKKVAGIRIQHPEVTRPLDHYVTHLEDDTMICRCERVTAGEIRSLIRQGYRDVNAIKIVSRAGMGACGSKTCSALIARLFQEEGVPDSEVVPGTRRPLFIEVPLGVFAGATPGEQGTPGDLQRVGSGLLPEKSDMHGEASHA